MRADSTLADTVAGASVIVHHVYHSAPVQATLSAPPEEWWQSNLASAIAGAVLGALVVIVSQVVGDTTMARRRKEEIRRRLTNEMAILVVQCEVAARALATHLHAAGTSTAPVELCLAAFEQLREDLGVFRDSAVSYRVHGWYGDIYGAVAMVREQVGHADLARERRTQLAPEADGAMRSVARIFELSAKRGKRVVEFVLRADRFAYRPRVRRLRRKFRRLRYSVAPWS